MVHLPDGRRGRRALSTVGEMPSLTPRRLYLCPSRSGPTAPARRAPHNSSERPRSPLRECSGVACHRLIDTPSNQPVTGCEGDSRRVGRRARSHRRVRLTHDPGLLAAQLQSGKTGIHRSIRPGWETLHMSRASSGWPFCSWVRLPANGRVSAPDAPDPVVLPGVIGLGDRTAHSGRSGPPSRLGTGDRQPQTGAVESEWKRPTSSSTGRRAHYSRQAISTSRCCSRCQDFVGSRMRRGYPGRRLRDHDGLDRSGGSSQRRHHAKSSVVDHELPHRGAVTFPALRRRRPMPSLIHSWVTETRKDNRAVCHADPDDPRHQHHRFGRRSGHRSGALNSSHLFASVVVKL